MKKIIDISEHQPPGQINYEILSKNTSLVIIRTQYGSRRVDHHYRQHHQNFKKHNVPRAAYAWVRGISTQDMAKEARDFYMRTVAFNPLIWFLDVEEQSMANMREGVSAYIKQLRSLGAKTIGLYIAHHRYKAFNLKTEEADIIWLPHYGKNNGKITSKPNFPYDLHQYTDRGRLPGYQGYLDLNVLINKNKFSEILNAKPTRKLYHHVVYGDTVSELALKYRTSIQKIQNWNQLKDVNKIYVGDKLRVG